MALRAMVCSSVIIDNLDVRWARRFARPFKTDPPLVVHANAVLSLSIALQCFETVARQGGQVLKDVGRFKAIQLEPGRSLNAGESFHAFAGGEVSRSLVAVADNQSLSLSHRIMRYVMRNK